MYICYVCKIKVYKRTKLTILHKFTAIYCQEILPVYHDKVTSLTLLSKSYTNFFLGGRLKNSYYSKQATFRVFSRPRTFVIF